MRVSVRTQLVVQGVRVSGAGMSIITKHYLNYSLLTKLLTHTHMNY